jgi:EF-P beta-lysylation protein EpmB
MIPVSAATLDSNIILKSEPQTTSWQQQMAQSLKTAEDLLNYLNIKAEDLPYEIDTQQPFALRVTHHLANLINPKDPYDPILLQVLPTRQENSSMAGFVSDPLEEKSSNPLPGLIHKYKNRVLIIAHQACAMHCRYCFRRHFEYQPNNLNAEKLETIRQYLSERPEINEIILSGGDPLCLSDQKLATLLSTLSSVPHLKFLRIHSRTPIALPSRLSDGLVHLLSSQRLITALVVHVNHANELSDELVQRLLILKKAGITLLNQSVLLKSINDCPQKLTTLSEKLYQAGVLPYYLHLPDQVKGTAHFYIDHDQGAHIWQQLQKELPGYLLPRLVKEIPGQTSKTWLNPAPEYEI